VKGLCGGHVPTAQLLKDAQHPFAWGEGGEGALPLSPHESWEPQDQRRQRLKVWGKAEGG